MTPLPIDDVLPQLLAALREQDAVVLQAPTGAGKTTRVPPAIWDAGLSALRQVVVLQPRRLAARATAARMASERNTCLGDLIGYQVRFEKSATRATRLLVCTEGILLRRLQDDPFLDDVGVVVFDEFHERNLNSELALGMIRKVQQSVRPDLKIVVMSATLAAQPIAKYLDDCPVVVSQGRLFPVTIDYLPTLDRRPLSELIDAGVRQVLQQSPGDVLVFLPGVAEIRQACQKLQPLAEQHDIQLHELYGDLPPEKQDAILRPGTRRKIILSTNVAETSVTIDGVTAVVDSGLARVLRFDPQVGLDKLQLEAISRASAEQRAGRAGRLQPGVCLRLWPEAMQRSRAEFDEPEIRRLDLAGPILQLKNWIEPDLTNFPWYERPREHAVQQGLALLERLDALVGGGITDLGRQLASFPVHPRLARLLLTGAELGCLRAAAWAAALLSERDPFEREQGGYRRQSANFHAASDISEKVAALEEFADTGRLATAHGTLHRAGAKNALRVRDQLMRLVSRAASPTPTNAEEALPRALLAAFPDRLAKRREPRSPRAIMVGGKGVILAPSSVISPDAELFLCIEATGDSGEATIRQASAVERAWLPEHLLRTVVEVGYDEQQDRLQARQRKYWDTLLLEETTAAMNDREAAAQALAVAASDRFDRVFPPEDDEATQFVQRVRCLNQWMPGLDLPGLDDAPLRALLPLIAHGCRSLAELRRGPWLLHLKNQFSYQQLQTIEREVPERIQVPSGSQIKLRYEPGKPPILAVRIQEIFGLEETPRIAGGRVRVLLHLLAPNYRPQQVTEDLRSFWENTYPVVRKELRVRYPKHAWPEDPWTAEAQSRPRRK